MTTSVKANQTNSYQKPSVPVSQKASQAGWGFAEPFVLMGKVVLITSPLTAGLFTSAYVSSIMVNVPMKRALLAQSLSFGAGTGAALLTAVFLAAVLRPKSPEENGLTVKKQDSLVGTVTGANFKREVLQSKLPVVVDAYATWCGPCKAVAPIFASLSAEMKGKVKFVKFNVEEDPKLSKELNIEAMPTFLFYKNGVCVGKHLGGMDQDWFKAQFVKYFL
jgi:thioredoxin